MIDALRFLREFRIKYPGPICMGPKEWSDEKTTIRRNELDIHKGH